MREEFLEVIKEIEQENFKEKSSLYDYVIGEILEYLVKHPKKSFMQNLHRMKSRKHSFYFGKKLAKKLYKENKEDIERMAMVYWDDDNIEDYLYVANEVGEEQPSGMVDDALRQFICSIYTCVKIGTAHRNFFKDLK